MRSYPILPTLAVCAALLAACGQPRPTAAPAVNVTQPAESATTVSTAQPAINPDTLPADAWFSIQATGKTSPTSSDMVVVYADGRAVYINQPAGQEFDKQLDEAVRAMWQRMFIEQADFMSLKEDYPATTPAPDDNVHYTLRYRQGNTVKTVHAQRSASPDELQTILNQFWPLIDYMQSTS